MVTEGTVYARFENTVEQASVQPDGTFRLMGLKPAQTYLVSVESSQIAGLLPSEKPVMIPAPSEG